MEVGAFVTVDHLVLVGNEAVPNKFLQCLHLAIDCDVRIHARCRVKRARGHPLAGLAQGVQHQDFGGFNNVSVSQVGVNALVGFARYFFGLFQGSIVITIPPYAHLRSLQTILLKKKKAAAAGG